MWETSSRILLFIMGILLIGYGAYLSSNQDSASNAFVVNGTGIICLIFSFLSKFKKFKGFGIEGELWEEKQHEADELIEKIKSEVDGLHNIVETVAESSFTSISSIGRMNPVPPSYKLELTNRLENNLKQIGLSTEEIIRSKQIMIFLITYDLASCITKPIIEQLRIVEREKHDVIESFEKPIKVDEKYNSAIEVWRSVSSEIGVVKEITSQNTASSEALNNINTFLKNTKYLSSKRISELKANLADEFLDLECYIKTKELRRPEHYAAK